MKSFIGDRVLFLLFLAIVIVMFLTKSFTIAMIIFINVWLLILIANIIREVSQFLKSKDGIRVSGFVKQVEYINTDKEAQGPCKTIVEFFWPTNAERYEIIYYANSIREGDKVAVSVCTNNPMDSTIIDQFTKTWKTKIITNILVVIAMALLEVYLILQQW